MCVHVAFTACTSLCIGRWELCIYMCVHAYVYIYIYIYIYICEGCSSTEIPTIIDPSATINYPSATGSIIVGISVPSYDACIPASERNIHAYIHTYTHRHIHTCK
jgi:hypothetical protein